MARLLCLSFHHLCLLHFFYCLPSTTFLSANQHDISSFVTLRVLTPTLLSLLFMSSDQFISCFPFMCMCFLHNMYSTLPYLFDDVTKPCVVLHLLRLRKKRHKTKLTSISCRFSFFLSKETANCVGVEQIKVAFYSPFFLEMH